MVDLVGELFNTLQTPVIFLIFVFVFAFLAAIIHPIPIEVVLLEPIARGDLAFFVVVAFVMAGGKTVGGLAVFWVGLRVTGTIQYWSRKARWIERLVHYMTVFVTKTRAVGLFLLLSVPLMSDTVPIYIYALFQGTENPLNKWAFTGANFAGALVRATVVYLVATWLGIELV